MPNIKSAKKRVLVIEKKTQQNKAVKSALKTQVKKFLTAVEAGNKEEATKLYPETVSAIDAADVVLMKSTLLDVAAAIRLSRAALRNIHENLFWAFIYNVIGIPLAAGVFVGLGLTLNPMYGAAAMSLSSFCVVSNALRLNLCKLYSAKHDHKGKPMPEIHLAEQNKEETGMTKTLHVKGMMCGHCEARVKKALEAVDGVASAVADHNNGTAVVTLTKDVSNETLKAAVEAQDYEVTGVE